jgi:hypothetical protein
MKPVEATSRIGWMKPSGLTVLSNFCQMAFDLFNDEKAADEELDFELPCFLGRFIVPVSAFRTGRGVPRNRILIDEGARDQVRLQPCVFCGLPLSWMLIACHIRTLGNGNLSPISAKTQAT